jgi:hypothetical protein
VRRPIGIDSVIEHHPFGRWQIFRNWGWQIFRNHHEFESLEDCESAVRSVVGWQQIVDAENDPRERPTLPSPAKDDDHASSVAARR